MASAIDSGRVGTRVRALAIAVAACFGANPAHDVRANPTMPNVVSGAARFTQTGNLLTVTNSPNAIINWGSFSIGANEITRFVQQSASSAVLNRVVGQDPSTILGSLQSNGRVLLINPNGIVFGAGSQVNVAGLVASTLNMSDADFLAGRLRFNGGVGNALLNQGNINASQGGGVYLVGSAVTNNGIITSPKGDVILAAGNSVELVNPGTPDLRVQVVAPDNQAVNLGEIVARSGRVGIHAGLIRNSGTINANSVDVDAAGRITLRATKDTTLAAGSRIIASGAAGGGIDVQSGGTTIVEGARIEAVGSHTGGGTVKLLGDRVGLALNTTVDVTGRSGGGAILVGGAFQGNSAEVQNATRTYVGADVRLKADSSLNGNGGTVVVWANGDTRYYGSISARGGARGGNGGLVEVSGKEYLTFDGTVDTLAPAGKTGMLLLDPLNITIDAVTNTALTAVDQFSDTPGANVSIRASNINAAASNVTLQANNDITVGTAIAMTTAGVGITLQAGRDIILTKGITTKNGNISLTANDGAADSTKRVAGTTGDITGAGALNAGTGSVSMTIGPSAVAPFSPGGIATTGAVTGSSLTVTAPNAVSMTGAITITGATAVTSSAGAITLTNVANDFTGSVSLNNSGAKNVSLRDKNALVLGASNVGSGTLTLTAAGAITQTGALVQSGAGNVTITAGAANGITLNNAGNDFVGQVRIVSGRDVTLTDKNAFAFGAGAASAISGNLSLTAAGAVTQANNLTVTKTTTVNAGANAITLTNATNNFTGAVSLKNSGANNVSLRDANALVLDASTVGQNLAITAGGTITQTGALTVPGSTTVTATVAATDVLLGSQANNLTGAVSFAGTLGNIRDLSLRNTNAAAAVPVLSTLTNLRNLTLQFDTAAVSLPAATLTAGGNLSVTAGGAISQTGVLIVPGTSNLNAGANAITLTNAANNFTGAVSASNSGANAVQLTDVNAIQLGTIFTANNLTVNAVGVTQNASGLTVTGTTTIDGGASVITLTTATNDFTGAVSLNNSGANNVSLRDTNALVMGASSIGGNLTITAGGAVTQTAAISAAGLELLGVGASYTLTNAANSVGKLAANTGSLSYVNAGALTVGTVNTAGISATGLLDVRTQTGNLILANAISTTSPSPNAVTLVADVSAIANASGTGGNFVNSGSVAITTGPGGAWRIYSGNPTGTTRGGLAESAKRYNVDEGSDPIASGNRIYFRNQPVLTLTANDEVKTYGSANPAFTVSVTGLIDSDTQGSAVTGAPSFTVDGTVSTSGNLTAGMLHNIIPSGATSALGYTVNHANGTLTVNKLALTGAAIANVNTTYGTVAATGAVSFGNVQGADVVTPATATIVSPVNSSSGNLIAGTYKQNVTGVLGGADAGNYTFAGLTTATANFTVAPRLLTTAFTGSNRVYDASTVATITASDNRTPTDVLAVSGNATFTDKNVGLGKTINITSIALSGVDAGNYALGSVVAITTANITPAAIANVTGITANNKVYDATTGATLNTGAAAFSGLIGTDALTVASASGAFTDKNAANGKTVNISGITLGGADAGNYTLTTNTATAIANITPAAILSVNGITAVDRTYDGTTAASLNTAAAVFAGALGGDALNVAAASATFADKHAGAAKPVSISGITLGGIDAGNYTLQTNTASATASIAQRPITVVAVPDTKVYDGTTISVATPVLTSGSVATGDSPAFTQGFDSAAAGNGKLLILNGLVNDGRSGANYAVTLAPGNVGTITPRPIMVTPAAGQNKVYGEADPLLVFSVTVGNLVGADTLSGALSRVTGENAGSYAITPGTLSNSNYSLALTPANFAIQPRSIAVIADNQVKVYGTTDPALTFRVGASAPGSGLAAGDTQAAVFAGALARGAGENVVGSPYVITQGTLSANSNYSVSSFTPGQFVINPALLTVTADNKSRATATPNPPFSASFSGFAVGEGAGNLGGTLAFMTPATVASPPGSYVITPSGLSASNYTIRYVDGKLDVTSGSTPVNNALFAALGQSLPSGAGDSSSSGVTLKSSADIGGECYFISGRFFDCRINTRIAGR